jgi:hypothetical protein
MRLYRFNYFADRTSHVGEQWATSSFDVERLILAKCPRATGIDVWVI